MLEHTYSQCHIRTHTHTHLRPPPHPAPPHTKSHTTQKYNLLPHQSPLHTHSHFYSSHGARHPHTQHVRPLHPPIPINSHNTHPYPPTHTRARTCTHRQATTLPQPHLATSTPTQFNIHRSFMHHHIFPSSRPRTHTDLHTQTFRPPKSGNLQTVSTVNHARWHTAPQHNFCQLFHNQLPLLCESPSPTAHCSSEPATRRDVKHEFPLTTRRLPSPPGHPPPPVKKDAPSFDTLRHSPPPANPLSANQQDKSKTPAPLFFPFRV
jgi:hypothetical protein